MDPAKLLSEFYLGWFKGFNAPQPKADHTRSVIDEIEKASISVARSWADSWREVVGKLRS